MSKIIIEKNTKKKKCEYCNYIWIPRTLTVKACPRCKRYFYHDEEDTQ